MLELLYLSQSDVARTGITVAEIIAAVEEAFLQKGLGRVEMPPKPGIHTRPDAFIHAMPAYIPALNAAGMKWVAGYPDNHRRGLPYINGLIVLNDPETGLPLSVMDCTWITAQRTGAATAVAAKYLARPDLKTVGIIGCGVQGRSNLAALKATFPQINRVLAYDVVKANLIRYVNEMSAGCRVEIVEAGHPKAAVEDADIVVTSGPIHKDPTPVIEAEWLKPGVFACPLDFDSYLTPRAFASADKLYTDDTGQQVYYRQVGYFKDTPEPRGDLGEVVAGTKPRRQNEHERIIAINLGVALEDVAVSAKVYQRAVAKGIGLRLPL